MKPNTVVQSSKEAKAGRRRLLGWPARIALFVMTVGLLIGLSGSFIGEPFYEQLMVVMERLGAPEDRGFLPVPNPEERYLGPQTWASPVIAEEMGREILVWTGTMIFMFGLVIALFSLALRGAGVALGQSASGRGNLIVFLLGPLFWAGVFLLLFGMAFAYLGGILDSILYEFEPALEDTWVYGPLGGRIAPALNITGQVFIFCGLALIVMWILHLLSKVVRKAGSGSSSTGSYSSASVSSGSSRSSGSSLFGGSGSSSSNSSSGSSSSGGSSGSSGSEGISNAAKAHMAQQNRRGGRRGR